MSERYKPKKLMREAQERWQRGEFRDRQILGGRPGASHPVAVTSTSVMRCRLHNNPWNTCTLCGVVKPR